MQKEGSSLGSKTIDGLLKTVIALWFPASFYLKWTTGPGTVLYDGSLNAEFTSLIILWLAWITLILRIFKIKKAFRLTRTQCIFAGLICLYTLWTLASVNWSVSAPVSFNYTGLWLHYLLFTIFFALTSLIYRPSFFMKVFAFWSLILSLHVIYLYYRNGCYVPYLGTSYNRSIVGEALCGLVPLLLAASWLLCKKPGRINLYAICAILGYLAVLIMGQRAPIYALWIALAGLGAAGTAFVLLSKRLDKKVFLSRIGVSYLFILILSLLYLIPSPLTGNLSGWDTTSRIYNVSQASEVGKFRVLGLALGGLQLKEHPLTGSGGGTFPLMNFSAREKLMENPRWHFLSSTGSDSIFNRAHCEPAQVAAELGLPGLFLWAALFIFFPLWLFMRMIKTPLREKLLVLALISSTGALAVSSLASSFGPRTILCMLPWLAVIASTRLITLKKDVWTIPKPALALALGILFLINIAATMQKVDDLKSCYYADQAELRLTLKPVPSFQEIFSLYEKSIEASPHLPSAYSSTALLLARHGKLPEAIDYLEAAYSLGFQSQFNLFLQSYSLWLGGNRSKALEQVRLLAKIAPESKILSLQSQIFQSESLPPSQKYPIDLKEISPVNAALMTDILRDRSPSIKTPLLLDAGNFAFWLCYYIQPTVNDTAASEKQALYLRLFYKPINEY